MILLITDSFMKLQNIKKCDYFLPQLNVLNSEKIHDFEIMWSQDKPLAESAKSIKEKILQSRNPVTVLAHGKAGLDAIECLIQYPELQEKVEKIVTLQTPFWGTPIADFLTGHPVFGTITMGVCKVIGCSLKAIEEMSELNRQVYMILNKEKIRKLILNVSVITVGSSFEAPMPAFTYFEKIMKHIHGFIGKYAGLNDGIMPLLSTRIFDETHMRLQNVTHMTMVTPSLAASVEVENMIRNILKSTKLLKPFEYPTKFPWDRSGENSDSKLGHSYQQEIS